ncbi:hypothetical protein [Vibrio sp. TBV020]
MDDTDKMIKHLTNLVYALERDDLSDAYRAITVERLAKVIEKLKQSG